jgi:hypothetical protein
VPYYAKGCGGFGKGGHFGVRYTLVIGIKDKKGIIKTEYYL